MIEKTVISLNNYKYAAKIQRKPPMCYVIALNQVKKDEKKNEQPKNAVYLQRV